MSSNDVLVADLYESVLRPDKIPDVLGRINRNLDCDGIHLVGKDEDAGHVFASMVVGSQISAGERDYLAHYFRIDPRLPIGQSSPTGLVVACHDFLDDRFVSRSEFYQDFLIPHGPRYIMGGNIYRQGGRNIHVAINHLIGRPKFSKEKRDAVSGFMYHLSRWANQLFMVDEVRRSAAAGFFGLEALGQGVLIFDDRQNVLFSNPAAGQLLGDVLTPCGFRRSWGYRDSFSNLFKQVVFDRQVRSITVIHKVGGYPVTLLLSFLPLPRDQGIGMLMPKGMEGVSQANRVLNNQDGFAVPRGSASVLVLVRSQVDVQAVGNSLYKQAFGFTAAESRLADALTQGQSPKDYAMRVKVSIATVRSQIRSLLSKTGAVNLRALVLLLGSLPKAAP